MAILGLAAKKLELLALNKSAKFFLPSPHQKFVPRPLPSEHFISKLCLKNKVNYYAACQKSYKFRFTYHHFAFYSRYQAEVEKIKDAVRQRNKKPTAGQAHIGRISIARYITLFICSLFKKFGYMFIM